MASLSAICVLAPMNEHAMQLIAHAGIRLQAPSPGPGNLWITVSIDDDDTLRVARAVSSAAHATTFVFVAQRTADVSLVAEFVDGSLVSQWQWLDGEWTVWPADSAGSRPWHADLHFADFDARLDVEPHAATEPTAEGAWSNDELARAHAARAAHDLAALPRLPRASFEQIQAFMLPFYDAAGAHATYRQPLLSRR